MLIAIGSELKDISGKVWEVIDITIEGRETSIHMQYANIPKVITPMEARQYYELV